MINSTEQSVTPDLFLQEAETYRTYKVAKFIDNYYFPVLIPLRLLGNTLSFLVVIRPNNRKVSTCIYMAAISINDKLMPSWTFRTWYSFTFKSDYPKLCKLTAYGSYLILQNSTFQIVAMTIDKYITIKWPHKAATYSTPSRAKVIILVIFIFAAMYNLPHYFMANVVEGQRGFSVENTLAKVHSWLSFVLNGVMPFTLLIHMNYAIVKTVRDSREMFREHVKTTGMETQQKTMKSAESQLTTMLLFVTTLFLILIFPSYIRFIYAAFSSPDTPSKFADSLLISEISYHLYVTNSGLNFLLYCISGQKFRNDLKEMVRWIGRCGYPSMSTESPSEPNTASTTS